MAIRFLRPDCSRRRDQEIVIQRSYTIRFGDEISTGDGLQAVFFGSCKGVPVAPDLLEKIVRFIDLFKFTELFLLEFRCLGQDTMLLVLHVVQSVFRPDGETEIDTSL